MIPGIVAVQRVVPAASPPAVFPAVRNAQAVATSGSQASQTISITATSGDLIIVNFNLRAAATPVPALSTGGWTLYGGAGVANGTSVSSFLWYKVASGSESLTITPSVSNHCASSVFVIEVGTHQGVIESAISTGSGQPNPNLLTPSWGSAKTLWIASYGQANGTTVSVYPLPDNNASARSVASSAGCSTGMCSENLEAASYDPGTFTLSATAAYVGRMIGVQPA